MTLPAPPLLLISDRQQAKGDIVAVVAVAFAAGCRWMSLREKDLPKTEQLDLLREILTLAKPIGARITLHGDANVSREAGAHGVHLAAGSNAVAARSIVGKNALVGLSIHSVEEARSIDAAALDYVIAGPVFQTQSKPGYGPALGADGVAAIARASPVPVIAIGGITPEAIRICRTAGAAGIAVMGSVMRAGDPGREIELLLAALQPRPR